MTAKHRHQPPRVIPSDPPVSSSSDEHSPFLGPCLWFALCDREADRLVPHPAFPGGVPTCARCYERSRS